MLGGLNNKIKGGKKILSRTVSIQTVESEIAKSLEKVQLKFKKVAIKCKLMAGMFSWNKKKQHFY